MGAKKRKRLRRHGEGVEHGVRGHPVQGRRPHDPRRLPHDAYEPGPFNPFAWVPGVLMPRVAGGGGLLWGGRQLPDGPFAGVGPRGYARSDQRVLEEVCDRLTEHGELDVHDVTVEVKDGEVTLEGTVPNRFMRRECEQVAEDVLGVEDVHNHLVVASGAGD